MNYLTLDDGDGWHDKIRQINLQNDTLMLTIERSFQEGFSDIVVQVLLNDRQSTASVVSDIERETASSHEP